MGISEQLGELYAKIENKFFELMDTLEQKGIPVYDIINPIEAKGIPAFPLFIAILFLLIGGVTAILVFPSTHDVDLILNFVDNTRTNVDQVDVSITDLTRGLDIPLQPRVLNNGATVTLTGIPIGGDLEITAKKEGYDPDTKVVPANENEVQVTLLLGKDIEAINARIKLLDQQTQDGIRNARVVALTEDGEKECYFDPDDETVVVCPSVLEGEEVTLTIKSDNYEDFETTVSFSKDETKRISLAPKPSATTGESTIIVKTYDATTKKIVGNVSIKIYDVKNEELLHEIFDEDGEVSVSIPKQTSVRFVVEKNEFAIYDSYQEDGSYTLRDDEEVFEFFLKSGGATVHVNVTSNELPLSHAVVQLYDESLALLDVKETEFGGFVEFENLAVDKGFYITAVMDGYLPNKVLAYPGTETEYTIDLLRLDATNSETLNIFVNDADGKAGNETTLKFMEFVDGKYTPLGLPNGRTDITGFYSIQAPITIIQIEATRDSETGLAEIAIEKGVDNKVTIDMVRPEGSIIIRLLDAMNNPMIGGQVRIEAGENILFDGENKMGEITIQPGESKRAHLTYTFPDNKTYTEELNLEAVKEILINVSEEQVEGLVPQIEFVGTEEISGTPAEGLVKGKEYYLKFKTQWPVGMTRGGFHVRVGPDTVKYVDSQGIGLTGFSAVNAQHFYGRTFTPTPVPGFEAMDLQNKGRAGEYNKFLELYFNRGGGTNIIKTRIKIKESAEELVFPVSYRGWTTHGEGIYRTPQDTILGNNLYTLEKSGLYADTETVELKIFEASPECENEFCAAYRFVDDSETNLEDTFKGELGRLYALEIEMTPPITGEATIKASTSKTAPKITFTGTGIESFSEFPDANVTNTSINIDTISLEKGKVMKARIFFKAIEEGNANITTQVVTASEVLTKTFHFDIYEEKFLTVKINPEEPQLGDDFFVSVKDDKGNFITEAIVQVLNEEDEVLKTVKGRNTTNKGKDGLYKVKNGFDPGSYMLKVTAPGYQPYENGFSIAEQQLKEAIEFTETDPFVLPNNIQVIIQAGTKNNETVVLVRNKTKYDITNLTVEIEKGNNFPVDMDVKVAAPEGIRANSSERFRVQAEYFGTKEREYADVTMKIRGRVMDKYDVESEGRIEVRYNPAIDLRCIQFSKPRVVMYMLGDEGASKQATIHVSNVCDMPIEFTTDVAQKFGVPNKEFTINVQSPIKLDPRGAERSIQPVSIDVVNRIPRNYGEQVRFTYDVYFRSPGVTRVIPIDIIIWNRRYALQMNRNIEFWLSEGDEVKAPLLVRNLGQAPLENLSFSMGKHEKRADVNLRIETPDAVRVLNPGEGIVPPKNVVATLGRTPKETGLDVQEINVKGTIDGKQYDFGPIVVTSHVSPPNCITVMPSLVEFVSKRTGSGAMSKTITIKNECAEDVRIRDIQPNQFGSNDMVLSGDELVKAGESKQFNLTISKRMDYLSHSAIPMFVKAYMVTSGKFTESKPFNVYIELGRSALSSVAASESRMIPVCGSDPTNPQYKQVSFPKIAKSSRECTTAYCDAQTMSEFLIDKIKLQIRNAEKQIKANLRNEVANSNCAIDEEGVRAGYCMFENLGVKSNTYEVFFMNDNLSTNLLMDTIQKKIPGSTSDLTVIGEETGLRGYRVEYALGEAGFKSYLGTGLAKRILLSNEMKGCGKFRLKITGAAKVQGNRIMEDYIDIFVELVAEEGESPRQVTNECLSRAQNILNFLPLDKDYTAANTKETWLGTVETQDQSLRDLSKDFAKALFTDESRAVPISGTNKLLLEKGAEQGYLVQIELREAGEESQPRTVHVLLKQYQPGEGEQSKIEQEIVKAAGQAIREIKSSEIDGCITEAEDKLLIKSTRELGELKLSQCGNGTLTVQKGKTCCDFNVSSDVGEPVKVSSSLVDGENPGVTSFRIEKNNIPVPNTATLELTQTNPKGENYETLALCVEGNDQYPQAHNKQIQYEASSAVHEQKRADPQRVTLQACGIHPYDFLRRISGEEVQEGLTKYFYGTLMWKGQPDSIKLSDLKRLEYAKNRLDTANRIMAEQGTTPAEQTKIAEDLKKKKLWALAAYGGACAVTSGLINAIFPANIPISILMDCGIPVLMGLGDILGFGIGDLFGAIKNGFTGFFSSIAGASDPEEAIRVKMATNTNLGSQNQGKYGVNEHRSELLTTMTRTAAATISTKSLVGGIFGGATSGISGRLASLTTKAPGALANPVLTKELAETMKTAYSKEIEERITRTMLGLDETANVADELVKLENTVKAARIAEFENSAVFKKLNSEAITAGYTKGASISSTGEITLQKATGRPTLLKNATGISDDLKSIGTGLTAQLDEVAEQVSKAPKQVANQATKKLGEQLDNAVQQKLRPSAKDLQSWGDEAYQGAKKNLSEIATEGRWADDVFRGATEVTQSQMKGVVARNLAGFADDTSLHGVINGYKTSGVLVGGTSTGGYTSGLGRDMADRSLRKALGPEVTKVLENPPVSKFDDIKAVLAKDIDGMARGGISPEELARQISNRTESFTTDLIERGAITKADGSVLNLGDDLKSAFNGVDDLRLANMADDLAKADELTKGVGEVLETAKGGTLTSTKAAKVKGFFKNVGAGLAKGLVAQLAGVMAWSAYWNTQKIGSISPTDKFVGQRMRVSGEQTGDYETDIDLVKGNTYFVTSAIEGGVHTRRIRDISEVERIPTTAVLLQDCTGEAFEKNVSAYMPTLLPNPAKWGSKGRSEAQMVVNYYTKYGQYSAEAAQSWKVPEEMLVVLGIWYTKLGQLKEGEYITGCNVGESEYRTPSNSFACAARELNPDKETSPTSGILGECVSELGDSAGDVMNRYISGDLRLDDVELEKGIVSCVFGKYGAKFGDPGTFKDYDEFWDTYNRWSDEKFSIASAG